MKLFQFENEIYLYGLLLIPILIAIQIVIKVISTKKLKQFGDKELIEKLMPMRSNIRKSWKFGLLMLALIALFIGLANPQIGSKIEKSKRKGIDLIIAIDISNSMLAQDITPNRLERAKMAISQLIDKLEGDRIGIVVFAGKAYPQLPITTDYAAAKMFLSSVNTDFINVQGTSIASALELCTESFEQVEADKSRIKKNKAIIIITDGEDHEEGVAEASQECKNQGIKVYTVGMGLAEGSPIPMYSNGKMIGFKKDNEGNTVITKLNESMLQQIAKDGDGSYVRANNSKVGLEKIFEEINSLQKGDIEINTFNDYEDRFQYLFIFAFIILIIEFMLSNRKSAFSEKFNRLLNSKKQSVNQSNKLIKSLIVVLFTISVQNLQAQSSESMKMLRKGNEEFAKKEYKNSEISYRKAIEKSESYYKAKYNLAASHYKQANYVEAAKIYSELAAISTDSLTKAKNYHNLGNSQLMQKKYEESIESYKNALKNNPNDADTRYNLAYAQRMLNKQKQDQKKNQDNKKQDQKQDQKQDNQQKNDQNKPKENKEDKNKSNENQQDKNKNEKQNQKPTQNKIDKKDADKMLQAMQQKEKNTKEKLDKQKVKVTNVSIEKDW